MNLNDQRQLHILKSYGIEPSQENLEQSFKKGLIDEDLFVKASEQLDIIKGGKKANIGETRTFGGREYIKTAGGWKFHGKGTGAKAQEHKAGAEKHAAEGGKSVEDHAKEASEAGLNKTIKESPDAKLRQAAHNELERRKKEEHPQEEKQGAGKIVGGFGHKGEFVENKDEKQPKTFREILADKEGRKLIDSIEERIGDLKDNPGRKEHMEDVREDAKRLKEKFGYDYDISEQEEAFKQTQEEKKKQSTSSDQEENEIIGHTKSGKPIYHTHNDKVHQDFTADEHWEALKAHQKKWRVEDRAVERVRPGYLRHDPPAPGEKVPAAAAEARATHHSNQIDVHEKLWYKRREEENPEALAREREEASKVMPHSAYKEEVFQSAFKKYMKDHEKEADPNNDYDPVRAAAIQAGTKAYFESVKNKKSE